jgi:hypothetical protein
MEKTSINHQITSDSLCSFHVQLPFVLDIELKWLMGLSDVSGK